MSLAVLGGPILLLVLLAATASWLPINDPIQQDLAAGLTPPMWLPDGTVSHPLGTDALGRDILARLVFGGRLTFLIAAGGVGISAAVGTILGMTSGYYRGWVDVVISRAIDAQLALPFILLALSIISARGRSLTVLIFVLVTVGWAPYARIIRADTLALRERPFVLGLRAAGASGPRIIFRHILRNVMPIVVVLSTLEIGTMILAESALSFLGLGVVSPQISWGAMLADGRTDIFQAWWVVALPGITIALVVVLANLLGDRISALLDPREVH